MDHLRQHHMNRMNDRAGGISRLRRRMVMFSPLLLLAGCDWSPEGGIGSLLHRFQSVNDWLQGKVFDPRKLSPELPDAELTPPSGFRLNSYNTDEPEIDVAAWRLEVLGRIRLPGRYTLGQIAAYPRKVMNTKHCCVEGWSMNVRWGGTPLALFLDGIGADPEAKYVAVTSADGYSTTYDMPSARHPQTLLCYEAYNKPLDLGHGAPLRIVMPTKLGYKSAKWITSLEVTNRKKGGYWEDQGYDWFAGL